MVAKRALGYQWHLRQRMAEQSMFATTDLIPLLAERGVVLSSVQIYRLVVQKPERLNLQVLVALCDILGCSPADLIEPVVEARQPKRTATGDHPDAKAAAKGRRPTRARILPDDE